ncbi:hypothetical protein Tco_1328810 [Tanacetum coccineum]
MVIEGILDSTPAGKLIYMALVDLIAAEFLSKRMKSNFGDAFKILFLGAGLMASLAGKSLLGCDTCLKIAAVVASAWFSNVWMHYWAITPLAVGFLISTAKGDLPCNSSATISHLDKSSHSLGWQELATSESRLKFFTATKVFAAGVTSLQVVLHLPPREICPAIHLLRQDSIHSNEDTDKVEEHGRLDDSTRACKATQVQENVNGALIELMNFADSRFFIATAFAAGVILATGDVHMLPDYTTSHLHRYLGLYSYWNSNLYGISGLLASLAA